MANFIDEILNDIDWRITELACLKSIPVQYSFKDVHKELHLRYSVPAIYSIWEGYVKSAMTIYINHLSKLNIQRSEISLNLLTHYIDTFCNFQNPRQSFETKKRVVSDLDLLFIDTIQLVPEIPTKANVNFKVLSQILERFCIDNVDEKYEKKLDRLLFFRNKIAHGENAVKIEQSGAIEFIDLVENLMLDIVINIQASEERKAYKKIA